MGGFLGRNELDAYVSQSAQVNPLEQSLSRAQQDRRTVPETRAAAVPVYLTMG